MDDVMGLLNAKGELLEAYHDLMNGGMDREEARAFIVGASEPRTRMIISLWLDRDDAVAGQEKGQGT
jgi:hypothetical protein